MSGLQWCYAPNKAGLMNAMQNSHYYQSGQKHNSNSNKLNKKLHKLKEKNPTYLTFPVEKGTTLFIMLSTIE